MVFESCAFHTARLDIREWHTRSADALATFIVDLMTEPVTAALPPEWQGPYTPERAATWIAERDAEGPTLLVVERATDTPVGLVILYEIPTDGPCVDARLGYLFTESAWGRGFASELLAGLIAWCRADGQVRSLTGGVAPDNHASIRVLEKNGFRRLVESPPDRCSQNTARVPDRARPDSTQSPGGDLTYTLDL